MRRKDPLRVLDAIYTFDTDERSWMRGIVDAAAPYDIGSGVGGYVAPLGRDVGVRSVATTSSFPMSCARIARCADRVRRASPEVYHYLHAPSPVTTNLAAGKRAVRASRASWSRIERAIRGTNDPFIVLWAVSGGDATVETALLWVAEHAGHAPAPADRAALDLVGAHLGAALRLRALVRQPTADGDATEAVLSAGGRVLDVRGAHSQRALPLLVDAVRRWDRAHTRLANPVEALSLWTALVDGRWSIVEVVERDGKRMLLACRNSPRAARIRQLSARERIVAEYAALGHAYKYIAYELGLSLPTVSTIARTVLRKLGLKSRAELIATFGGPSAPNK